MDSQDWKDHRYDGKLVKAKRRAESSDVIELVCLENDIDLKINTEYHFSLLRCGRRIDYFPTSGKYHDVTNNKRGRIKPSEVHTLFFDNQS